MERSHLAAELLDLDPAKGRDVIASAAADATDARAQVLALGSRCRLHLAMRMRLPQRPNRAGRLF